MKNLIAIGLALVFARAALAGVLPSSNSGTISVYVPGAVGTASTQPAFQGVVAFRTTGTGKLKNPRVWLACFLGWRAPAPSPRLAVAARAHQPPPPPPPAPGGGGGLFLLVFLWGGGY